MTVAELKEILEDLSPDTEVRIASQPQWPFEYSVADTAIVPNYKGINDWFRNEENTAKFIGILNEKYKNADYVDIDEDGEFYIYQDNESIGSISESAGLTIIKEFMSVAEIFYIAEGTQIGYLPGQVNNKLDW